MAQARVTVMMEDVNEWRADVAKIEAQIGDVLTSETIRTDKVKPTRRTYVFGTCTWTHTHKNRRKYAQTHAHITHAYARAHTCSHTCA